MPLIAVRDIELWYDCAGQGPRLLAISGTGSDLRRRPNLLDSPLVAKFEVLSYDQRGLGRSSKPDRPFTMADYADDAANLMDAIGWERAHIVGVSFGGMVAQELALRHPEKVIRLALCCTAAGGAGGSSFPLDTLQHLAPQERARRMIPISDIRNGEQWAATHPETFSQLLYAFSEDPFADEPGHRLGARRQLEARSCHDAWERLIHIRCPTLVCGGRYDGQTLPESLVNLAKRIPDAVLRLYEGGHQFLWQDPTAWPELVEFLSQ